MKMTTTKSVLLTVLVVFLIFLPAIAWLGYLGYLYPPYVPIKAPVEAVSGRTAEIWRVTAYCPEKCCCGRYADYITASGHFIKHPDKFIAAPKEIPFGTWIDVPGYGMAEVLDRGGAIKGRRLDVYFPTHQEALNWGVKYLELEL